MAKRTDIPLPRANSQASKFGSKIKKSDIKVKRTDIPLPMKNSQASKFGKSGQDRKKKTLKEKVKQQADWLWRDIKSDFLPTAERQKVQDQIAKEKKAEYNRKGGFKNDKVGQFYTGLGEGFVNSSLPGTAYSIAKGKKLSDKMEKGGKIIKPPTKNAAQARKIGNIAGEMLGYATGYGAAEKATTKAAGKVLATKAGKKATEKAVASKVGKKIGEEATKQVLKSATKNAIADATVGTAMDLGLARGEGKKGKELAKDMAVNAGINAVTGGVMEAIPVVKALKGSKKAVKKELPKVVKQAVRDEATPKIELPKTVAKQAENVKIDPKMELPTANSVKNSVEISEKTHNAKKIELIPKSAADVGPQPTAVDLESTLNQSVSNPQNNVKLKDLGADVARPNQAFKDAEIAPPIKQAAEEVKVTPSGKETKVGGFDVAGKQNLGIVNPDIKTVQEAMENASGKFDKFYKATVNQQHEIDRLSKASGDRRAADAVQATRSASGTSEYIFTNKLVNPNGDIIDNRSFKDVFMPVSKNSKEFNVYAQNLNNIARWAQDKPLDRSVSAEESQRIVNEILKEHPEFAKITQDINDYWQKFTHAWLVDTGRMNEQAWKAMIEKYPNYVPAFMKDKGVRVGGSKFAVDAGTKGAKAGTTLDRVPIEDAMMEQVQQLVKSTRKNDMYLSVIDTLRKDPENLKRFGIVKRETCH